MRSIRVDLIVLILVLAIYAVAMWYGVKRWREARKARRAQTPEGQIANTRRLYLKGSLTTMEYETRIAEILHRLNEKET